MKAIPLVDTQLTSCATPSYLKQHGVPTSFSDLGSAKLILMSPLNSSEALRNFFNKEKIHLDSMRVHTCNDIEGVYQSVRTNMGIGMLLDISIQEEIQDGTFISILEDRNLPLKRLYLI